MTWRTWRYLRRVRVLESSCCWTSGQVASFEMRAKVLAILSATVLVAAVPQPARFDQRQTGTYNLHVNLKDGQVFAVVKDVLVSAPVRNFAVTLKGPIASHTTESPRTDGRTGVRPQQPIKHSISPLLKTTTAVSQPSTAAATSNADTTFKTPAVAYPHLKVPNTGTFPIKATNAESSPGQSLAGNGTSNNRRQNNKVSSQIINQQTAELVVPPPPPPPPPTQVQAAKPTLSPLPPLPPSIIAALTDQRTTNQRIQAMPDEINEIDKIKTSFTLT